MTPTFLIGLAMCLATLLVTVWVAARLVSSPRVGDVRQGRACYYEKRCAQLQADLDFATHLLAADLDDRLGR